jgi:uncharacterized iron-regulated membrane protein
MEELPFASVGDSTPKVNLDDLVRLSQGMYPNEIVYSVLIDDDEPKIVVFMVPSWKDLIQNRMLAHSITFDAHTARILRQSKPYNSGEPAIVAAALRLHKDLFQGASGSLIMGIMAFLLLIALVSGAVLYGPSMRKIDFGTVRRDRSSRIRWLDMHNVLGIVTLAWLLVIGATGAINELSGPMFSLWQRTELKGIFTGDGGSVEISERVSLQAAIETASAALPEMNVVSIAFPGSPVGSSHHYLIWGKGREPLTSRLFAPVLIDAKTGSLVQVIFMPWYLRVLEIARPLHFGDYGGLPLKVLWVALDLITCVLLTSGLILWSTRQKGPIKSLH